MVSDKQLRALALSCLLLGEAEIHLMLQMVHQEAKESMDDFINIKWFGM